MDGASQTVVSRGRRRATSGSRFSMSCRHVRHTNDKKYKSRRKSHQFIVKKRRTTAVLELEYHSCYSYTAWSAAVVFTIGNLDNIAPDYGSSSIPLGVAIGGGLRLLVDTKEFFSLRKPCATHGEPFCEYEILGRPLKLLGL